MQIPLSRQAKDNRLKGTTKSLDRNEIALLALKQLHHTFVQTWNGSQYQAAVPDTEKVDQAVDFQSGRKTLVSLRIGTMPARVIVPNQTATTAGRT